MRQTTTTTAHLYQWKHFQQLKSACGAVLFFFLSFYSFCASEFSNNLNENAHFLLQRI